VFSVVVSLKSSQIVRVTSVLNITFRYLVISRLMGHGELTSVSVSAFKL
jgi:hypothetical protein